MRRNFWLLGAFLLASTLAVAGCCTSDGGGGNGGGGGEDVDFKLGDLIEPFDPPTLEELEAAVAASGGWVDQPVLDSMQLMRERQAGEPQLATVEEALKLRNNSDEENDKIVSALGRLPASDDVVNFDAVITRTTPQALNHMNPLLSSTVTEQEVSGFSSFGLFSFDWNFTPFAATDSVVSWQTSKDGMYDKVVMRDDLLWSDGEPITAHDIEFSFQLIMTKGVPIPAMRSGTEEMKCVKAYDDHTVVFFHKKPLVTNVWNINYGILPKHVYEDSVQEDPTLTSSDHHIALEDDPVVGGGYQVVKRDNTE
ncbi:MAG: peptide ABC transporter substrate-binding protein, partial [Planctomycetales bacterium]|nr:peptide ABC transporter substrate-binding protein [Planctomycetales bacterium]